MNRTRILFLFLGASACGWCQSPSAASGVPSAAAAPVTTPPLNLNLPAAITDFRPEQWFNPAAGDMVDTDAGTLVWKGRTFDLGTSRAFRARFERYLNVGNADIDKLQVYQSQIAEVLALLSPLAEKDGADVGANVDKAYRILYEAAKYPGDAGASTTLAHMIFNSWRLRSEIRADGRTLDQLNAAADRRDLEQKNRAAMASMSGLDGRSTTVPPPANLSIDFSGMGRNDQLAGKALAESLPLKVQFAKVGFQSQIVYFLTQRRYEHVLMSTAFYRLIFKGSAQELQAGKEQLKALLPSTDMIYSVEALERLANEAITDVGGTLEVVRGAIREGDLSNATERLQETFHLGEFLAPVATLPETERRRVREFYRLLRTTRDFAALKDYKRLLESSARLKEMAADYNHAKVQSECEAAMQASGLALASAKMELARNNHAEAQKLLREAATLWPLNPALATLTDDIGAMGDASARMTGRFDEALARKDLRSIFDARHEMGIGLLKDPERASKLKEILDQVARADLLLAQADAALAQDNAPGAWEAVILAEQTLSEDRLVFAAKSKLLTQAVDFARVLDEAKRDEDRGRLGASFARYQQALDLYPASQFAREGQRRLAPLILARAASR